MNLRGSRTEINLLAAFAGESQAQTRYSFFASTAKKEGYEQIAAIFQETAGNEREHAKLFFNQLQGGRIEITAGYPAGTIGTTKENLLTAAEGEKLEWGSLYPDFAGIADQEGFPNSARIFRQIARVESFHERRYRKLLANMDDGRVFTRDAPVRWLCRNCGLVLDVKEAPAQCPACDHSRAYFEIWMENY
jgi:rubrerythrin